MEAAIRKKIEEDTIKKHLKDQAKLQNGGVSPKSESESESSSSSEDELKGIPEDKLTFEQRIGREVDRRYKKHSEKCDRMGKKKVTDLDDFIVSSEKVNGKFVVLGKRSDYGEEESKDEEEVPV